MTAFQRAFVQAWIRSTTPIGAMQLAREFGEQCPESVAKLRELINVVALELERLGDGLS